MGCRRVRKDLDSALIENLSVNMRVKKHTHLFGSDSIKSNSHSTRHEKSDVVGV